MEKNRELVTTYGFTETIDCGALSLHIFDGAHLDENSVSKEVIELASIMFDENNIPCLESSGLEILPETDQDDRTLAGYVNFEIPEKWRLGEYTYERALKKLQNHLGTKVAYVNTDFKIEQQTLIVNYRSQEPLYVKLEANRHEGTFQCYTRLTSEASSSYRYDEIVLGATLWGHIHDFVVQSDATPFSNHAHDMRNVIFVGETDEETISDLEIMITSRLEHLRAKTSDTTLPQLGDDIDSKTLNIVSNELSDKQQYQVVLRLIENKRKLYGATGEMSDIQQDDIIAALVQQLQDPRR